MSYRGYDKRDRIQNLWVMSLPNATPESVGVSTTSQRDAALEGKGLPWMMLPGTPGAHIMIPINPPAKSSTITDQAADEITQATLPLPEDLRAGATVYKYDPKTGERIVLRKGTNFVECTPRGADGFTWCYNSGHRAAPRPVRQAPRAGEDRQGNPGGGGRGDKRRHDQADAVRDHVVSSVRQEGSHPAAVGALGAGRHAGIDRRVGRQPARRGDQRRRTAVADAAGHARRAHHDSDQQVRCRQVVFSSPAAARGSARPSSSWRATAGHRSCSPAATSRSSRRSRRKTGAHGLRADVSVGDDNARRVEALRGAHGRHRRPRQQRRRTPIAREIGALDVDAMREMFDTNVFGLVDITNRVVPLMKAQGQGDIVNIASTSGHEGRRDRDALRRQQVGACEASASAGRRSCGRTASASSACARRKSRPISAARPAATIPNKLYAEDIGETIMAALDMPRRALWPELAVFANNPWKED